MSDLMDDEVRPGLGDAMRATVRVLGRRNLYYVAFTLGLVPLTSVLDGMSPHDPNSMGAGAGSILLWILASVPFVLVNAVLFLRDTLTRWEGGRPLQALLACTLPFIVLLVVLGSA